ncbi:MAG TPA: FkbM family methyltransferase [Flavobacterium sp.]|nr:FkbM family methyltransferase [Flavobacterium sp.]
MQKITNLYRLDFSNKMAVLSYLLKRIFRLKTTERERQVNDYYFHLITLKGKLAIETDTTFTANYPKLNVTAKTRKRPSSDLNVFDQIFKYLEYKPVAEAYIENFKSQNGLKIIDAGSNIGLTSVYLSRFFKDAEFVCIEPDQSNFEVLSFNLEANKVEMAHKVLGGVWSKNTNLRIVQDFRDRNDWSFRVEETAEETGLKAFSIPSIIEKYQFSTVDILKIDIEGSEKEVFLGTNADVSFLAITKCIAIEIHDEFDCRDAIYKVLEKYGFTFFNSGELTIGINRNFLEK